tara:strand:- start:4657 stop:5478 length:822 start_codon:yes stop_codon:yes gene_type:complete
MKFCYCDETGTGVEPYAVLLGVVVDSSRMHLTKSDWTSFLSDLSKEVGKELQELHTRNFYSGSGVWKGIDGPERSLVIDRFINWFANRKHHVVMSAIDKSRFQSMKDDGEIPDEIGTIWKAMGFHVALAMQKRYQNEAKNKGNTVFIFDEEVKEEVTFQRLILNPPEWSESYYKKKRTHAPLNQIVDAPYFADSKNVALIQVADFLSYFVRRYIEIQTGSVPAKYAEEEEKIQEWFDKIKSRSIPYQSMYPKNGRCETAEMFWGLAPECIRNA